MNLKERLRSGDYVCGIMLSELATPNIARILANCCYDFMLVDCEHGCFDLSQVANLISVADGHALDVFVRISQDSIADLAKYLDMGARGILLSNTESVAMARDLIKRCLYKPLGERGISTFRAHTNYCKKPISEIMRDANEKNIVIAQIESPEAVRACDDICALEGLDGLLVGPNDLTQHMGMIGEYDRPEVRSLLKQTVETARRHGKWAGIITGNSSLLAYCKDIGMTCFSAGSELNALTDGAKENYTKLQTILRKGADHA